MSGQAGIHGSIQVSDAAGIRRIAFARPPLNVLTTELLLQLAEAVEAVEAQPATKVVVVTGEGPRAFCAGVDIADHTPERVADMMHAFARAVRALLTAEVPVIAALNGAALGGGFEIALACDVVFARDGVAVGQPEIRLGVFPPVAAVLLPRLIGRQLALDLILSGRTLRAEEARALGLIAHLYSTDTFESEVGAYARALAAQSAPVLRLAKRAVTASAEAPLLDALQAADRLYLDELMALRDPHEGLRAFMEKRTPVWGDA